MQGCGECRDTGITVLPWIWLPVHGKKECKVKENWFHSPNYWLQTTLDYTNKGHHIVSRSFNSHIIPKIGDILKNAPSLNYVSAKHLLSPCLPSLFKSLYHSNPNRQVLLNSYNEETQVLVYHEVYKKIHKIQYVALKQAGKISKAILEMCVLVVKNNKDGKPLRSNTRVVVLGSFEDRLYQKSQRYAPVLKYSSLCLLTSKAVGGKRILQQGIAKTRSTMQPLQIINSRWSDLPLVTQISKTMITVSSRKYYIAYVDLPIIGTIW